jgi:hypothetical protein
MSANSPNSIYIIMARDEGTRFTLRSNIPKPTSAFTPRPSSDGFWKDLSGILGSYQAPFGLGLGAVAHKGFVGLWSLVLQDLLES